MDKAMTFLILVEFEAEADDARTADDNVISELESKNLKYVFRSVDIMDCDRP